MLVVTLLLSLYKTENERARAGAQVFMAALYIGLFAVAVWPTEYASSARWAGHNSIRLYVQKSLRDKIEFRDKRGRVLVQEALVPDQDFRITYFWVWKEAPATVRIVPAGGSALQIELGDRPGG